MSMPDHYVVVVTWNGVAIIDFKDAEPHRTMAAVDRNQSKFGLASFSVYGGVAYMGKKCPQETRETSQAGAAQ